MSKKWQSFYKWYCILSCSLVLLVGLLILIGGNVWDIRHEGIYRLALYLCGWMVATMLLGLDALLCFISFVVWVCRRESVSGWTLLACSVAMFLLKVLNLASLVALTGGV